LYLIIIPLYLKKNLKKKNVNLKTTEVKSFSAHRKRAKPHIQQSTTSTIFFACGGLSSDALNSAPSTSNSCIRHCTCGVYKFRNFLPISRYISQTIQDIGIVTIEGEKEAASKLSKWHQFQ